MGSATRRGRRGGREVLRRHRHDRQPEQPLERDQFADVVTLDTVADPLEQVADDNRPNAPVPVGDDAPCNLRPIGRVTP